MNVIFGSGIVGLLARAILGDDWTIVPFGKSRIYTFNPAIGDNFIIVNDSIEPVIKKLCGSKPIYFYKRAWSIAGELVSAEDEQVCNKWLSKIFGFNVPPHAVLYHKKMTFPVYDIRINSMYRDFINMYSDELVGSVYKNMQLIGDHEFVADGKTYKFERAISTIPLNVLCNLMRVDMDLPAIDLHAIHAFSTSIDLEGYNQALVVDDFISFFKVTNIAPNRYIFYMTEELENPGIYLSGFVNDIDILDGVKIEAGIPAGAMPNLSRFRNAGIECIGGYAQWDWCMDVGSCIYRLLKYRDGTLSG